MRISFLVPDVAGPVLGPVTVLAGLLANHYPVQIIGPDFGRGVCPMYRGAFEYDVVPTPRMYRFPNYFPEALRLGRRIRGDIIVAVKAVASTVPVALWQKKRRGAKVLVYLDEWDGCLVQQMPPWSRAGHRLRHLHHPLNEVYYPLVEKLIPFADGVISTSTFMQRKFGGHVVPMGVDTDFFRPQESGATQALKRSLGLEANRLIVFGGVVRPHKGVETILRALVKVNDPDIRFVVVGPETDYLKGLAAQERYAPYMVRLGAQEQKSMPRYLDLADLIILPLADNLLARSQVPCKIFEAMSMAKPIIATAISDLPAILDGVGWVVAPGDGDGMASAIKEVISDRNRAVANGRAAREKCRELYSNECAERMLMGIVEAL